MTWLFGWILDNTPWWLWLIIGAAALAPVWPYLPSKAKAAIIAGAAIAGAYLAGRNKGAAGADARSAAKDQANADTIRAHGARARVDADRDALSGGLRSDDGHKREGR